METKFNLEDSLLQERILIKELVELRQCRHENQQLLASHGQLISKIAEMEVQITELEVQVQVKDLKIHRLESKLQSIAEFDKDSTQSELSSISNRTLEPELESGRTSLLKDSLETKYLHLLKEFQRVCQERDHLKNQVGPIEEYTHANMPNRSKRTHTMSLIGKTPFLR